eukprot:XP_011670395.1 PREDICTED: ATP-binding cassette sub-family A member 7-like [Strongylocentrotus purpuratus]
MFELEWADERVSVQNSRHIFGSFTRRQKMALGDFVLAMISEALMSYLPAKVTGVSGNKLTVEFCDGSSSTAHESQRTTIHYQLSKQNLGVNIWLDAAKTFGIVIVIVAALVLIPSAFSMFLVNENINGSKRLHYVSGVGTLTYWLTNLFWDMLSFCIPVGLMLLVFYIFDFRGLILTSNVGAFVALVFLYGFAIMCQIYILIPFFKESGTAFIFLFCLLLLAAVITNLPNFLVLVNAPAGLIQNQALADLAWNGGGYLMDPLRLPKWHFI